MPSSTRQIPRCSAAAALMVLFIALQARNYWRNAGDFAVAALAKPRSPMAIVCRPGMSFTRWVRYGTAATRMRRSCSPPATAQASNWQRHTICVQLRFRRSAAASMVIRQPKRWQSQCAFAMTAKPADWSASCSPVSTPVCWPSTPPHWQNTQNRHDAISLIEPDPHGGNRGARDDGDAYNHPQWRHHRQRTGAPRPPQAARPHRRPRFKDRS